MKMMFVWWAFISHFMKLCIKLGIMAGISPVIQMLFIFTILDKLNKQEIFLTI